MLLMLGLAVTSCKENCDGYAHILELKTDTYNKHQTYYWDAYRVAITKVHGLALTLSYYSLLNADKTMSKQQKVRLAIEAMEKSSDTDHNKMAQNPLVQDLKIAAAGLETADWEKSNAETALQRCRYKN